LGLKAAFKELRLEPKLLNRGLFETNSRMIKVMGFSIHIHIILINTGSKNPSLGNGNDHELKNLK